MSGFTGKSGDRLARSARAGLWCTAATTLCVPLLALSPESGWGADGRVRPREHDVYLRAGHSDTYELRVDVANPPPSTEPLDILLLFDATMSMRDVIETVRARAGEIMQALARISTNCAFGVASFGDYPPYGHPWSLHQDLTLDHALATRALQAISLENGGDIPEAYSRALYESQFLSWRPAARRFIVLFGDAPAHDGEFYGKPEFGIDPGRDGVPGTADDLRLRDVVEQVAAKGIKIIAVHDSPGWFSSKPYIAEAIRGFEFMATETGGLAVPIRSADQVPHAIQAGVREAYRPIPRIAVPGDYESWVGVSRRAGSRSADRLFGFGVTLQLPEGTPAGIYRFPLRAVFDSPGGGEIGGSWVTIRTGLWNYPWRLPLLFAFLLSLAPAYAWRWARAGRDSIRYLHNRQFLVALSGLAQIAVLALIACLIWAYAPGTLPPPGD